MTLENILRYLEHGYVMKPEEQIETAEYIRQLQQSNETLRQGLIEFADQIFMLRRELTQLRKDNERAT
jgi:predicted RNase H-like nuclease (RuvC/YqgF family)